MAAIAAAIVIGSAVALAPSAAHAAVTAVNDEYTLSPGTAFTTPPGLGVLANDLGVDLNALIEISTSPVHGGLGLLAASGEFMYQPYDGFVGVDMFAYCVKFLPAGPCITADATVTLHVEAPIERIGGADRYAVSAGVSAAKFVPAEVLTVYIASGEVFPDALSASAAAGADDAPVLLVTKNTIPAIITTELLRLAPWHIIVIGGTNTISPAVETALAEYAAVDVTRIAGADRFEVSAGISAFTFGAGRSVAYIASGEVFPDALSGSAAAGTEYGPVLLVQKNAIPESVATELERLVPGRIVVLGGTNTIADSVVAELQMTAVTNRIAGADRFEVSANVSADAFMPEWAHTVYVASGEVFPDALSGSAAAINNDAPVLLVTKNTIPATVAAELDRLHPTRIVVLGGTNTISDAVYTQLEGHLAP